MAEQLILITSDSDASSPTNACSIDNDDTSFEINYYKLIPNDKSPNKYNPSLNKPEVDRTLTKQHRLVHVLSDSEDSDNSCSKTNSTSIEIEQPNIKYILSDSERIQSASTLKCNRNKRRPSDLLSLGIEECQDQNEVVIFDLSSPQKKRKAIKKTNAKAKEEKLQKKEEEAKKRAERKEVLKLQRQLKPGECIKYMKVILDSPLLESAFGGQLLTSIQSMECQHQLTAQTIPFSITWLRELPDSDPVEETQMLLVWQWEQFVQSVRERTLCDDIKSIQQNMPGKIVTLVVYCIDGYFSYLKNKRRKSQNSNRRKKETGFDTLRTVTRGEMELALTELQIREKCNHRLVNTGQELGLLVCQFTKSISEIPFKKEKQKREQDNLQWFAAGDSRDCVRIDKEGNGLMRLWQQQLCQFNLAGIDTAQAIAAVYSSPQSLIQAYDKCETQKEGELLLQNIPVRRCQGPLAPARRIGPELSKKIYMFFNNVNGDCPLSQE